MQLLSLYLGISTLLALAVGLGTNSSAGFVKLDFQVSRNNYSDILRFDSDDEVYFDTYYAEHWYSTTLYIGSEKTKLDVGIDINVSVLYLEPGTTEENSSDGYDPESSSSFQLNSSRGSYGPYANLVEWGSDDVSLESSGGNVGISHLELVVENQTSAGASSIYSKGTLGVGLPKTNLNPQGINGVERFESKILPYFLKENQNIQKALYSIYFNTSDSSTGSILLGAIDHAKYDGQLKTVSLVPAGWVEDEQFFAFELSSLTAVNENPQENITISQGPVLAILVTSSLFSILPPPMHAALIQSLGAQCDEPGNCAVSCEFNTNSTFFEFVFSGISIQVPLSDMIYVHNEQCFLGVTGSSTLFTDTPVAYLADDFLRNAYVVYNLDDSEISLAQVRYSNEENIEVVSDTIPSATQVSSETNIGFEPLDSSYSVAQFTISGSVATPSLRSTSTSNSGSATSGSGSRSTSGSASDVVFASDSAAATSSRQSSSGQKSSSFPFFKVLYSVFTGACLVFA